MVRVVLVVTYLVAAAFAVVLIDANTGNVQSENAAIALWYCAAVLLGLGTGQPLWALLFLLVIAFAAPFGYQDPPVHDEAATMVFYAWFIGAGSAVLIVGSALARMVADRLRRPRVEG
jgi:hypothetical protein